MKGFRPPDFTAQIIHASDRPDEFRPMYGTQKVIYSQCAEIVATGDDVDYVLLVRGRLREGQIARKRDIVADFQRYAVSGAKLWEVAGGLIHDLL